MWYDQPPAKFADYLRRCAMRVDKAEDDFRTSPVEWKRGMLNCTRLVARRLRAAAKDCDVSTARKVGKVAFRIALASRQDRGMFENLVKEVEAMLKEWGV